MITTNQIYKKIKDAYQEDILVSKEFNVIVAICNLRKIVVCDYKTGEVRFEKKFPLSTNFFRCIEYQGYCIITDYKYCIFLSLSDYQIYNPLDYFSDTDYVCFLGVVKNTCYLQLSRKDQPLLIADVGIFLPNNQTFTRASDLFPQFSSCAFIRLWDNFACFDYHVGKDLYYKNINIYRLTDDLLPLPNPELKLGQLSGYFSIKVAFTYAGYIYFYAYTEEKPLDCVILQTDYSGNIINRFNHPNRNNYEGFKMVFAADLVSLKDGMSIVCRCTFHNIDNAAKDRHYELFILNLDLSVKLYRTIVHKYADCLFRMPVYVNKSMLVIQDEKFIVCCDLENGDVVSKEETIYQLHTTSLPGGYVGNLAKAHYPIEELFWLGEKRYCYRGKIIE